MRAKNLFENIKNFTWEPLAPKDWENEKIQDKIKKYLMDYEDRDSWKEYVNKCEIGGCQYIASAISDTFPEVTKIFGEVDVDTIYTDQWGEEQDRITHHWVEIDGYPYDFAKGTLSDHINWHDVYDSDIGNDDWRYHPIHKQKVDPKFKTKGYKLTHSWA